ncbi:MAG: NADH-quinone oxidoreductase subunit NuoF [Deltaproteobacteria bacterium]|nr:NADH-quinone oxidoreductase subunit NuoF [Deltaproteobacteria bacterium]
MGTCGRAAGAEKVLAAVEKCLKRMQILGRVMHVGCIGMCYIEPIMAVKKPGRPFIYYGDLTPERTELILESYLLNDDPLAGLATCTYGEEPVAGIPRFSELPMIKPQVRIALRNCGLIDPENIQHYIAHGGYEGLNKALHMEPEAVVREIKDSGLRGRGGAGFPTGIKWEFAGTASGKEKYFICNADEGDPGAFMDRSLLEGDPHSVLEGMLIGAYAIGATSGYIYVRAEYPLAIQRLKTAMKQMEEKGLLGNNILESPFSFHIKIKEGAGAFVCGEETAMMASIEGNRGMPRPRPPFPAQSGLHGMPTNINNVETLSNVSAILAKGAEWYAGFGTEKSRGTKNFSLAGNVNRTGLIEVPMGIKLGEIIFDIGGGAPNGKKIKAVQTGGPSGGCIPISLMDLPVDYDSLAEAGSIMGSGGMVVMDEDTCMVDMARYFLRFTQSESCGKCMPCRLGTKQMLDILEDICGGRGKPEDLELLNRLGNAIRKGALCGLGQTAPNPVQTTMRYFYSEYEAHINEKRCPAVACADLFTAPCRHACPIGMDIPAYIALVRQGRLDDAYKVLLRTNPFPSVCGRVCNHPCQSKCRRGALDEPVAIKNLKRYITDHGNAPIKIDILTSRDRNIAIIGAGPAGLTAARDLRISGYEVTVYEALPEAGGMLRYGIPEYRLPKEILKKEIKAILDLGIKFYPGSRIGMDIPWTMVLDQYDAVFLAIGAQRSAKMGIKGEDLKGVQGALEFLRQVNISHDYPVKDRVAVVGGGNSAIDAARTARRLGASDVHILYRREIKNMPAEESEIRGAEEEGINIHSLISPIEIKGPGGIVEEIICQRMELGDFDSSGRRRPVPVYRDGLSLKADQVLMAIGQEIELPFRGGPNTTLQLSEKGLIMVRKGTYSSTSVPKIFVGGDAATGPATVVLAIAAGHRAAGEIHKFLSGDTEEIAHIPTGEEEISIPMELDEEVMEQPQEKMPLLSMKDRINGFSEVERGYSAEQALRESCRCLRCDIQIEDDIEESAVPDIASSR